MKSLVGWHELYDLLTQIRDNLDLEVFCLLLHEGFFQLTACYQETPKDLLITHLPDVVLLWRLSVVREVILSGFQLELYSREEKSFAYWYAVEVVDAHLSCLDNLTSVVQEGQSHFFGFVFSEIKYSFRYCCVPGNGVSDTVFNCVEVDMCCFVYRLDAISVLRLGSNTTQLLPTI